MYILPDSELQIRSDSKLAIFIQGYCLTFRFGMICVVKKKERGSRGNVRVGIYDVLYSHLCGPHSVGL